MQPWKDALLEPTGQSRLGEPGAMHGTGTVLHKCRFANIHLSAPVINLLIFEDRERISICENFLQSYFSP